MRIPATIVLLEYYPEQLLLPSPAMGRSIIYLQIGGSFFKLVGERGFEALATASIPHATYDSEAQLDQARIHHWRIWSPSSDIEESDRYCHCQKFDRNGSCKEFALQAR